jgi:hypothetical protein
MRKMILYLAVVMILPNLGSAEESKACSNETLHSSYGFVISGSRPVPGQPGVIELVVGTALTTFDGNGNFIQTDNIHGQVTGFKTPDRPGSGTYTINADCTGTMVLHNDGVPFGLILSIVVVDNGKEIRAAVVDITGDSKGTPPPIMVTSNGRRVE